MFEIDNIYCLVLALLSNPPLFCRNIEKIKTAFTYFYFSVNYRLLCTHLSFRNDSSLATFSHLINVSFFILCYYFTENLY